MLRGLDFVLHVAHGGAELADALAQALSHLGDALGTEDKQNDYEDDEYFPVAHTEHGSISRKMFSIAVAEVVPAYEESQHSD